MTASDDRMEDALRKARAEDNRTRNVRIIFGLLAFVALLCAGGAFAYAQNQATSQRHALGLEVRDHCRVEARQDDAQRALDVKLAAADQMTVARLLALPVPDAGFDAATVGFGVRNVADLPAALAELRRVLRPEARLGILEITTPTGALAPFYRLWFDHVVPLLGKALKGGAAYTYLPASVRRFPGPQELAALLRAAGFEDVAYRTFAGGIIALHTGVAR
jgi:demethylmenaquinone methyltransferase / 2-methoxy-6-polyprenyl-1,4-benzoquinol methylase